MTTGSGATTTLQLRQPPRIVACGYKSIAIAKSGLRFPAWLVEFPGDDCPLLFWRSKRDFLRLSRGVPSVLYPKAAFQKLADKAPWRRPDAVAVVMGAAEQQNRWHVTMEKSMRVLDRFLQQAAENLLVAHPSETAAAAAWHVFCQPADCQQLAGGKEPLESRTQQRGNELGQYFCHAEIAQQLVQVCLEKCQEMGLWAIQKESSILFVEPSCGYGQVVATLLDQAREQEQATSMKIRVLGIDKDEQAVLHCKEKFLQAMQSSSSMAMDFCTRDFLQSRHKAAAESVVVVLGGPPYSAGAGHSTRSSTDNRDMQRDLPLRFVQHALGEYGAAVVAFIMPRRCETLDYQALLPPNCHWQTIPLQAPSTFYFQGKQNHSVTQPSILQLFWKTPIDTDMTSLRLSQLLMVPANQSRNGARGRGTGFIRVSGHGLSAGHKQVIASDAVTDSLAPNQQQPQSLWSDDVVAATKANGA